MKITIEKLNDDGDGIGYINNKVVFLPGALVGEVCDIEIIDSKKKFDIAKLNHVITKSDSRVDPQCKYYELCGGCDLMHMRHSEQVNFKKNKLQNVFSRNFHYNNDIEIISFNQFYYRNKVTLKVENKTGYYQKNSNKIVEIDQCLLADDHINAIINKLNAIELTNIDEIIIKHASSGLMIVISSKHDVDIITLVNELKDLVTSIYINDQLVYGEKYITDMLLNHNYLISNQSFYQVNKLVTEQLYQDIKNNILGSHLVLDLYAGIGTISTLLSDCVDQVDAIEINETAVESANQMLDMNHITNVNMIQGDVAEVVGELNKKYDAIIVDPPRSGLSNNTIDYIKKINPHKLIYVSCNPNTLVRDLKLLDYKISFVKGYDMFANTKHVEVLVVLTK